MNYYFGIDLGGTNIAMGIADENHKIIAKHSVKTEASRGYDAIVCDIAKNIIEFTKSQNIEFSDIYSVGIGVPAIIDENTKTLVYSSNLDWRNKDIINDLKNIIKKDVFLANDAYCATLGELLADKSLNHMAMLTLGTGVGSGVVIDGKIFKGGDNVGLELGHITLNADGDDCLCGNRGCVEMYCSATALVNFAKAEAMKNKDSKMLKFCSNNIEKIDGKVLFDAVNDGDASAKSALETYIRYLSNACANIIMCYRPDALILGGGVSAQEELLIKPVNEKVAFLLRNLGDICKTPIKKAKLGNDAGILGACFICKQ